MTIRAGELRHRVDIEEPRVKKDDASGEDLKSWEKLSQSRTWTKREDLTGRELFQAQQISARITTQFTMRYRTDITAKMRLVDRHGICWVIENLQDREGMKEKLILLCARDVN